jgi:hypothetical protein
VDHRVEPPAWLPQGAAPEAVGPDTDEGPAAEDGQAAEDSAAEPAEATPEEYANGNGHDTSHDYSSAGSYRYSDDDALGYGEDDAFGYSDDDAFGYSNDDAPAYSGGDAFAEGTTYRSPFTPHRPAGSNYAPGDEEDPEEDAVASGRAPVGAHDSESLPETAPPGPALPASEVGTASVPGSDRPGSELPGHDLPASGLVDPGMPDVGFPGAGTGYTDTSAPYTSPATVPYPVAQPVGPAEPAGTATGPGPGSGSTDTAPAGRTAAFGTVGAATGGIGAALRSGKPRGTARSTRAPAPAVKARRSAGQPRRANLVIARIEPWSVMKFSFLISLVLWLVMFVAVALLYYALSSLGVFAALQRTLSSVTASQGSAGVDLSKWTSATRVLGYTMLLGAVDVVLITAISTVGVVIYNLVTHLGGGIEVTLKETE